jgi:hypothetical protein
MTAPSSRKERSTSFSVIRRLGPVNVQLRRTRVLSSSDFDNVMINHVSCVGQKNADTAYTCTTITKTSN